MELEYKIILSKRRLEVANERLDVAEHLVEYGDYKTAANRLYYAVFAAMKAVLALEGFDSKKHSGIISRFRQNYVKTGVFDSRLSAIIDDLEIVREDSDYDDFYVVAKADIENQTVNAKYFVATVESYLKNKYTMSGQDGNS